jgi:rifampicin phosphotransferase
VRHGCGAGAAIVPRYNRTGLATALWSELLVALGERVVVDVSADTRQIIVPVDKLTLTLLEQLGHSGDDPRTVLVREFTTGEVGALCRLADGALRVEWSADGLLAINRGLATDLRRFIERDGSVTGPLPSGWDYGTVRRLRAVTEEFNTRGSCVIEWVASGTRLRAIDYSVTDADFEFDVLERATTISGGACQGPALVVGDALLGDLEATSVAPIVSVSEALPADGGSHIAELHARVMASGERPVVVVDRPFAILAVPGFEVEEDRVLTLLGNGELRVEVPSV